MHGARETRHSPLLQSSIPMPAQACFWLERSLLVVAAKLAFQRPGGHAELCARLQYPDLHLQAYAEICIIAVVSPAEIKRTGRVITYSTYPRATCKSRLTPCTDLHHMSARYSAPNCLMWRSWERTHALGAVCRCHANPICNSSWGLFQSRAAAE